MASTITLSLSELRALARSANVPVDVAEQWLQGLRVDPTLSSRLARVYRALFAASPVSVGGPPTALALATLPELS